MRDEYITRGVHLTVYHAPLTLGKQTSQYIAMGVRQSIQDDFSRLIEEAVKKPLVDFRREVYHAREVIT